MLDRLLQTELSHSGMLVRTAATVASSDRPRQRPLQRLDRVLAVGWHQALGVTLVSLAAGGSPHQQESVEFQQGKPVNQYSTQSNAADGFAALQSSKRRQGISA